MCCKLITAKKDIYFSKLSLLHRPWVQANRFNWTVWCFASSWHINIDLFLPWTKVNSSVFFSSPNENICYPSDSLTESCKWRAGIYTILTPIKIFVVSSKVSSVVTIYLPPWIWISGKQIYFCLNLSLNGNIFIFIQVTSIWTLFNN